MIVAKSAVPSTAFPLQERLLRLPQVLARVPVSRSAWWSGVKAGKFPPPVKLGPRTTAWRESEIDALITALSSERR